MPEDGVLTDAASAANRSVLWIDWGSHRRSQTLSQRLGVDLIEICYDGIRAWRYFRSILQTSVAIRKRRPSVVIATNPSIVLNYFLLVLRKWSGFRLVSDAHYFGVRAPAGHRILQHLLEFLNSRVDLVIVTNDSHARSLTGRGVRTFICEDPLPDIPILSPATISIPTKSVFLICSFGLDEPYELAFMAFLALRDHGFSLLVSGDYRKARINVSRFPWVRFLGFVPEAEYYQYLRLSSVVIDLTTMEDCLVCGAYEALAAGKPLVVSRTRVLGAYFGEAAILTENTLEGIRKSVLHAYAERDALTRKSESWAIKNQLYMNGRVLALRAALSSLRGEAD